MLYPGVQVYIQKENLLSTPRNLVNKLPLWNVLATTRHSA